MQRRVSSALFKSLRYTPAVETEVVILDIEYVHLDTVKMYLETLNSYRPKAIGVNLCNISDRSDSLDEYLRQNRNIITCDCAINSEKVTSRITTAENVVTHFRTDKSTYFEFQLADKSSELWERSNETERINFRGKDLYYHAPLSDIDNISPEFIRDKTVLVGFLRDSLITPMNDWYGRPDDVEQEQGDMSDAEISANIISTINRNEFINEVGLPVRVVIILMASLVCAGLIRLTRTKYTLVNIVIAVVILLIINGLASSIIVLAFLKNYYLELNEMTVVLIISSILSIYWNTTDKRIVKQTNNL